MNKNIQSVGFKVVAISKNTNSFGLLGHVLVSRDGAAYEVGRSICTVAKWSVGDVVSVPTRLDKSGCIIGYNFAELCCEIPRALPSPPAKLLREIFPSAPRVSPVV